MGYRAVFLDGAVFLLWAFACFASFGIYGFDLLLGSFGVVFGLVYGGVITLQQLKIIEKNGELWATRKMWAFQLLEIIYVVPLVAYFVFSFGLAAWERQMVSSACLVVAATHATQTGLFFGWERKQKKDSGPAEFMRLQKSRKDDPLARAQNIRGARKEICLTVNQVEISSNLSYVSQCMRYILNQKILERKLMDCFMIKLLLQILALFLFFFFLLFLRLPRHFFTSKTSLLHRGFFTTLLPEFPLLPLLSSSCLVSSWTRVCPLFQSPRALRNHSSYKNFLISLVSLLRLS
jgi:hypothetical protein